MCFIEAASLTKDLTKVLFLPSAKISQQKSEQNSSPMSSCWSSASSCFIHSNARFPSSSWATNSRLLVFDLLELSLPNVSSREAQPPPLFWHLLEIPRDRRPRIVSSSGAFPLGSLGEVGQRDCKLGDARVSLEESFDLRALPVSLVNLD